VWRITEMIKCKDCKHWTDNNDEYGFGTCEEIKEGLIFECEDPYITVEKVETPDGFGCSYGEAK